MKPQAYVLMSGRVGPLSLGQTNPIPRRAAMEGRGAGAGVTARPEGCPVRLISGSLALLQRAERLMLRHSVAQTILAPPKWMCPALVFVAAANSNRNFID